MESRLSVESDVIVKGQHRRTLDQVPSASQSSCMDVNCLIKLITWDPILSPAYISKASESSQTAFLISPSLHFEPSFLPSFVTLLHLFTPLDTLVLSNHILLTYSSSQHQNTSFVFWDCLGSKDNGSQTRVETRVMYGDCKYAYSLALNLQILIQLVWWGV